jgi:transcriptional regulator GlxA family with amidase domain
MKRIILQVSLLCLVLGACVAPDSELHAQEAGAPLQLNVGFLIVDGVYNTELTAPLDVFQHTIFHAPPGMRTFTVAPTRQPVTSFEGLVIVPDYSFADAPPIDVLVVPSAENNMDSDLRDEELIGWVRTTGFRAQTVMSLCDGAFVLARAGLLDGRRATTFPKDIPLFRTMFDKVDVVDGPGFVHDGPAITSVGGARSFDAALYLTEILYGKRAADGIAAGLLIDWNLKRVDHAVVPAPAARLRGAPMVGKTGGAGGCAGGRAPLLPLEELVPQKGPLADQAGGVRR